MTPFVIPFFIPHQGCPHQCLFCNQHAISGAGALQIDAGRVAREIREKLAWPRIPNRLVQVAFYGGSFTALPLSRQQELLSAVAPFRAKGEVAEIRISTRPDYITAELIGHLRHYGVGLVELGIQSLHDEVLRKSGRGHTVAHVEQAVACLRKAGLQVGGQLMVGLPGDSRQRSLSGAAKLAALQPDLVRIYPTLVMAGSPLADLYGKGRFQPWSLALATAVCAAMKETFDRHHIPVARLGLQSCAALEEQLLAGPYHPAFGELVMGRLFFKMVRRRLQEARQAGAQALTLRLAERDRSLFVGMNKENMVRMQRRHLLDNVTVQFRTDQPRNSVEVV